VAKNNLEKRGDIYYLRVMINGKLHRKSTGFKDYDLARRRATEMENEIRSSRLGWVRPPIPELRAWSQKWLNAYHPKSVTEPRMIRGFVAIHGHRDLNMVQRSDFETYFRKREGEGLKLASLERERVSLAGMFRAAVDDGILDKHPMRGIRPFKPAPRTRVMTASEEEKLLAYLSPLWKRFVRIAVTTGLRKSELLMARPMDVRRDGARLYLWVRPESNKLRKGRLVPLTAETLQLLQEQQTTRGNMPAAARFFTVTAGAPWTALWRACQALDIDPAISVHDLRRTFGTRCAVQGMYPKHLQDIMGHKNIEITMTYYVHLNQVDLHAAMEKVIL